MTGLLWKPAHALVRRASPLLRGPGAISKNADRATAWRGAVSLVLKLRKTLEVIFLMAKNPTLTLAPPPLTSPAPLRELGEHGLALWNQVNSQYDIVDAGGIELADTGLQRGLIARKPPA